MRKWTLKKNEMSKLLRKLARKLDKVPSQRDLIGVSWIPSHEIYRRVFKSFPAALKHARLTPTYFAKNYTEEKIKELTIKYYKNNGKIPRSRDFNSSNKLPDIGTVKRYFSDLEKLFREISLDKKKLKEEKIKNNTQIVIKRIKMLYKKYNKVPTKALYESKYRDLTPAYIRTRLKLKWSQLLTLSGLKPNITYYKESDKEELISKFLSLAKKLKRTPRIQDFGIKNGLPSFPIYERIFNGYDNLLRITGLSPNTGKYGEYWRMWERFCENSARALYGKIITQKSIGRNNRKIPDILIEKQKLRIDAMTSAYVIGRKEKSLRVYANQGYRVEVWCIFKGSEVNHPNVSYIYPSQLVERLKRIKRYDLVDRCLAFENNDEGILKEAGFYTDDELITIYHKLCKELGHAPTSKDIDNCKYAPHSSTFLCHLGSLTKLARNTGYEPNKILSDEYSIEELINHLQSLQSKLGRRVKKIDIENHAPPGIRVFRNRFGSLNNALKRAGLRTLRPQQYSDQVLLDYILKLYRKLNRTPVRQDFIENVGPFTNVIQEDS
jgi:hypothetical protein